MGQKRTTLICFGLVGFLLGLVLARRISLISIWLLIGLVVCLTPLLFPRNLLSLLSIVIIGMVFGLYRGTDFGQQLLPYQTLAKRQVTILATATSDGVYGEKTQLEFDVGNIKLVEPYRTKLVGTIGVRGFGEPMVQRGDELLVTAKLYPSRGSRQARMSFAKIQKVSVGTSPLNKMRRSFGTALQSVLPSPIGDLGLGILVGQRTTLPDQLNQQLSVVGLTHIVAVSGYNLTILVQLAQRLVSKRSKYQATLFTALLIGLFLVLTGSSASIVRAAIVSGLGLWAWYYGRTFSPMVLILLAAAITAGWFPAYLWSDVGWHLSFLAFFGVLVVAPAFQRRFLKGKKPKILLQLVIETTSAQIMTLPLIMYIFGRLSLVALLSNMLVVPLVPLAMGLSFMAGLAGMLLAPLAGWLAWPAMVVMTYMLDIVRLTAELPKASVEAALSVWHLGLFYGLIVLLLFTWSRKKARITDNEWSQQMVDNQKAKGR